MEVPLSYGSASVSWYNKTMKYRLNKGCHVWAHSYFLFHSPSKPGEHQRIAVKVIDFRRHEAVWMVALDFDRR
ncbi:Uncharacterized protein conserved in bacteria [Calderihabitans maritimus]|uniref:Uncharacterized protein conserved in bacteria n=1 Tax=Calderihabitans maritimus TaxID=1246530 RepID=A0A1Z5HNM5_9FIRM|nr:Uncharacterized protein conserved in bacteria [Calderihabitans maritimus]